MKHSQNTTETSQRQPGDIIKATPRHHRDKTEVRPRHPGWKKSWCMRGSRSPCKIPSLSLLGNKVICVSSRIELFCWRLGRTSTNIDLESSRCLRPKMHTLIKLIAKQHGQKLFKGFATWLSVKLLFFRFPVISTFPNFWPMSSTSNSTIRSAAVASAVASFSRTRRSKARASSALRGS